MVSRRRGYAKAHWGAMNPLDSCGVWRRPQRAMSSAMQALNLWKRRHCSSERMNFPLTEQTCYVCLVSDVSICVWNSQLHMRSLLHSLYGQFGLESAQAHPHLEPSFTVGASPGCWAHPSATHVLRMSVVEEPGRPFPGPALGTRHTAYFSRHLLICVPTALTQMLFRRLCVPEVRP